MKNTVISYYSESITASLKNSSRLITGRVGFTIKYGEKLSLIGETGSGKTITALSIMGLLPQNVKCSGLEMTLKCGGGKTYRNEEVFKTVGSGIVYIPQNGLESLDPSRRVRGHLYDTLKKNGCPKTELGERALQMLRLSGFPQPENIIDLYPFQLSGGMAQRVTIALAMTGRESLIIADEPTNGLDRENSDNFVRLLDSSFPQAAKLIITHDMALAALTDSVLVLKNGTVMEKGPSKEVLENPRCMYTKSLISALVKNGMKETPVLRGENGSCPFYSRCPSACEKCSSVTVKTAGEHVWRCI
ncbi:MAG: ABC transporter ATP-binding protein [Sphaerochaetaceae bacterium]|nr:ABC transporter ATP-binding protein [Sphaerochaetaceae bacterium]